MYKGLLDQPTFVYTECSDVTEVFVTEQSKPADVSGGVTSEQQAPKIRFRILDQTSSGKSRKTASPPRENNGDHCDVAPTDDVTVRPQIRLSVISKHKDETPSLEKQQQQPADRLDTIPEDSPDVIKKPLMTSQPRRASSDAEFLEFARDFARQVRRRPTETLLNPNQYDVYLQKVASRDRLHGNGVTQAVTSRVSCSNVRSSSLEEKVTGDGGGDVDGHVVGDLVCFAANTLRYFDNPDLSDVIIVIGEHRFYSHKMALAAQSDVFRDMLIVSDRCTGCPDFQKELELEESKECEQVFSSFLRFFYCGRISFTSETALPLLVLSAKYRVESLRDACDSFITGMIEDGDLKSSVKWLRYAARYQLHDLTTKCVDGAVADNIEELVDSPDWLSLPVECIEAILSSSNLLVPDEFFLFESLQRWMMSRKKSGAEEQVADELRRSLQHIRFSQMQGTQLLAVEESPVGLHYRSIVRTYLGDAYRYQILAKESPEFQEPQYLPRDYTDKQWCVQLFYHPTRNKRNATSVFYGNGRWEIQPRRYYDTLNVVIILKKPLECDVKVYISILIYKRNGTIQMRLRRKACVLRALDQSVRSNSLGVGGSSNSNTTSPNNTPRSNSGASNSGSTSGSKENSHVSPHSTTLHPHRSPHGPASKLHGPHNGQEYYAIDNIISDSDFQMAMSQSGPAGLKLGVIIRTWGVSVA